MASRRAGTQQGRGLRAVRTCTQRRVPLSSDSEPCRTALKQYLYVANSMRGAQLGWTQLDLSTTFAAAAARRHHTTSAPPTPARADALHPDLCHTATEHPRSAAKGRTRRAARSA